MVRWSKMIAAAALLAGVSAAHAADYPYSGRLTLTPAGTSVEQGQLYCAYNFFFQKKDGSFAAYHLDLAGLLDTGGRIRYLTYQGGTCTADATPSVESCLMSFDSDATMQGKTFIDSFRVLDSGAIELFYFESIEGARAFATGGDASREPDAQFVPCADPGGNPVDPYLTDTVSTLPREERDRLTGPELTDATLGMMRMVLESIQYGVGK